MTSLLRDDPAGRAAAHEVAGIYPRDHAHAGARDRRQQRHLQRRVRRAAEAASHPRSLAAGSELGNRSGAPSASRRADVSHHRDILARDAELQPRRGHGIHDVASVVEGSRRDASGCRSQACRREFFDTLGAAAAARPNASSATTTCRTRRRLLVLSYGTWVSRFGGDPVDRGHATSTWTIGLTPIVGVMPRGFDVPRGAQLWMPVVPVWRRLLRRRSTTLACCIMLGRLRPGVTRDAAQSRAGAAVIERASRAGAVSRARVRISR